MEKTEFPPTPAQAAAIAHKGSDLLISAGAGSGKTSTLTDRIVSKITTKDKDTQQYKDISRMLVVTFTKDAANELKARIAAKLSKRLKDDPKNPHLSSQLVKLGSADISTIHSFCLKLIRPHFDKLGLDSDFRIGEESELEILSQAAINRVIDRFYESDTADPDFLLVSDCYSEYTDEDALSRELLFLYKRLCSTSRGINILLDEVSPDTEFLKTPFGQVILERVQMTVKHFLPPIQELFGECCAFPSENDKYMGTLEELNDILLRLENQLSDPSYEQIKDILSSFTAVRVKGGRSKLTPTLDTELLGYVRSELVAELKDLRDEYFYSTPEAIASTFVQNKRICTALYRILKEYEKEYSAEKRAHSLCDFNDLESYAMSLLYDENGCPSQIAEEIKQQYDELYIDEYQDVNSVQDKIFSAISNNNRFMVGDIKQSIYGFRSAEPELFSAYRDSFVPYGTDTDEKAGKTIFMSDNFRCDPCVIDATNHVSDYMFLNSHGFNYVENDKLNHAKGHKKGFVPQRAELCIIDRSSISEDSFLNSLDPQAEFVAQEIKRLIDTGYLPSGEKIKCKHIAILLRKTSNKIERYIDALNIYGINNEYKESISFFEKPHISLLLSILNSIDNPSKDVYLAGAMHSHIWKFSLEELVKIKQACKKEYSLHSALCAYSGDGELAIKVKELLKILDEYSESVRKMSAEEAISYILNETGYLSYCNDSERCDVIKLYNIARTYEQGAYKGLYSFLRYIDDVAAQKDIEETVSSDPDDSVKIITMHKSKGLEYEVCFLCDTDSVYSRNSYSAPILFHRSLGICGYVSREGGIVKYDNLLRKCTSLAIKNAEIEEAMRILYVAMTRARSKLYITASITKQAEKRAKHQSLYDLTDEYTLYSSNSHIDILLGAFAHPVDFLDVRVIGEKDIYLLDNSSHSDSQADEQDDSAVYEALKERLSFEYKYTHLEKIPSKLSISTLYPEILDSDENSEHQRKRFSIDTLPEFTDGDSVYSGADVGTATHVFLQFCSFERLSKNGYEKELSYLLENSYISSSVAKIIKKEYIEKFISSEMMKELMHAKSIKREFRFNIMLPAGEFSADPLLKDEQILVQGVIDCIYENEKGELILVDYKTDRVTEENYVSKLRQAHTTQLTYYKKACEKMFDRSISKVLVYSVPLAKSVEIE